MKNNNKEIHDKAKHLQTKQALTKKEKKAKLNNSNHKRSYKKYQNNSS